MDHLLFPEASVAMSLPTSTTSGECLRELKATLASFGAHVLLLGTFAAATAFHGGLTHPGSSLVEVALLSAGSQRASTQARTPRRARPIPVAAATLAPTTPHPNPPSHLPLSDEEGRAGNAEGSALAGGHGGRAPNFSDELRAAIARNKEYPTLARARHQTGRIIVGMTLKKDGEIINVHLIQPSPYDRLNDAAVSTVKRLGKFKAVPDEISKGDWNVAVPMDFELNG